MLLDFKIDSEYFENENDELFFDRVYKDGILKYIKRVKQIGFTHKNKVLDFGCGYGQWSTSLASLNKDVVAADVNKNRLLALDELIFKNSINNIKTVNLSNTTIPFNDNSFDAVFAYSVLPFCDWKKALTEFKRVLKKGGLLYCNANSWGWYMYLWDRKHNHNKCYSPKHTAAQVLNNSLEYDLTGKKKDINDLLITPDILVKSMEERNLEIISCTQEGFSSFSEHYTKKSSYRNNQSLLSHILNNDDGNESSYIPFMLGNYQNQVAVYEVIARND